MVSLLFTVFTCSVVAMSVMIFRKSMALRGMPHAPRKTFILDATPHPHRIRTFLAESIKATVHTILLTITKGWLIITRAWKNFSAKYLPKIHAVFYEHPAFGERKESSFFLSSITEYKEKTKKLRERMRRPETKAGKVIEPHE